MMMYSIRIIIKNVEKTISITTNKNFLREKIYAWKNQQNSRINDVTAAFLKLVESLLNGKTGKWFLSNPRFGK